MIVGSRLDRHIDLRRGSPEHHEARAAFFSLETADIITQRLYHLPTRQTCLHMITCEALGVVGVEGGRHGHDLFEFSTHGFDVLRFEHLGKHGRLIGILGIDIPTAEHQVGETS